jgi:polyphosphate kinase
MKTSTPAHYLSRELSWLAFNQRVLDEALNPANPLLERVKFFTITSSNLDEFFEVRVAGLKQQVESDIVERSFDGKTSSETLRAIHKKVREMIEEQYRCWREELLPALAENNIHILDYEELTDADRTWVEQYYRANVRPVLTPLGIDPSHPFPQLLNKSLNIVVQVEIEREGEMERRLAVVQVPRVLPRLVRLPREDERLDFIYLGNLVGHYLADLFPGTKILGFWHFRVTRNSELYIDEEDIGNLLKAVENELHNRRRGAAVRLEADAGCPAEIYQYLLETLELTEEDLYLIDGPLNPTRLMVIYAGDHSPELPGTIPPSCATSRSSHPPRPPSAACRTFSPSFASATCWCIIPTKALAALSISSSRPPRTRTCWPSSRRSTAPAAIRASSAP